MSKKRGRPRKRGPREANGRLARAMAPYDRGSERAQERLSLYGQHGTDAIGRAYVRGFLGEEAKALLDTARAVARAYWAWYEIGPYACPLGNRSGSTTADDHEREARQEDWLRGRLRIRDRFGYAQRQLFDQLVINVHPDQGPAWLDRLIDKRGDQADWARLASALEVLAECAEVASPRRAAA
jgi:hypothetical protein